MPKRKTQEEFIKQAQTKHGSFYDYSKVEYINTCSKVTLICPNHGEFEINAGHHVNGVGCRKCFADHIRNTEESILTRFRKVHGDRYQYDKVRYSRIDLKVTIVCSVHGNFEQTPSAHIAGSGCTRCAIQEQSLSTDKFVEKAKAIHGDKYDYSQVKYINSTTKIVVKCAEHGDFEQLPQNHLRGNNCPECGKRLAIAAQNSFEYQGINYLSIKDACQQLEKDYWVVLKRLEAGWSSAQAFDDEPSRPQHPFWVNGVVYNGVTEAARLLNAPVSPHTVRRRIRAGMTPEESLFTLPKFSYDNGAVYLITNLVSGKQYVGLTTTSLEERWRRHLEQASMRQGHLIHQAIAEAGSENFTIEVLEHVSNLKELCAKEREWIQKLGTLAPNGYNITKGGELGGSPGKPTRLPGDPTLYPTVKAAASALAQREGISEEAVERRIHAGRIDVKKPHGMSKTRIYRYWDNLTYCTTKPGSKDYNGSTICDLWRDFRNFYEDMGEGYQKGMILQLLDPNQPYSQDNCFWKWRYK